MIQVATRAVAPDGSSAGLQLDDVEADHASAPGQLDQDRAQLPVVEPARLRQRVPGCDRAVEHVEVDRDVQRPRLRQRRTHDRSGPALDHVAAGRPAPAELAHPVDLCAIGIAKPERADGADERQLGEPPQLAGPGQARAAELVEEVGVSVDVDDVELAQWLQPATERVTDRVVAADRDRQCAALGDRPCGAGDPLVVRRGVGALDRDIADVGHRHAGEVVAVGLHVVPAAARAGWSP